VATGDTKLKLFYKTFLKKRALIDSSIVGSCTKPFRYLVNFRHLTNYSAALFDENPLLYENGEDAPVMHPLFPSRISWQMVERLDLLWDVRFPVDLRDHLIHQGEYLEILQPLKPGNELKVKATLISLRPHKLGVKITIRFEYCNKSGVQLIKEYVSAIVLGVRCSDDGRSIGEIPQMERRQITGDYFSEIIEISALDSYIYDGCSDIVNPIHTNREYARSMGLPGILLQGTATLARSVSVISKHIPGAHAKITALAGKFTGYVLPPDRLTVNFIKNASGDYFFETLNRKNEYVIRGGYLKIG